MRLSSSFMENSENGRALWSVMAARLNTRYIKVFMNCSRTNIRLLDFIIVRIGVITVTVAVTVVGGTGRCASADESGAHDAEDGVATAGEVHQDAGGGSGSKISN
jgi:hypothetical protein